jgi:hypothetical protein
MSRFVRVLSLVFAVVGVVLIVVSQWENFHNVDGHFYWPFIDLFPLFLLGCGFLVLAVHPLAWWSVFDGGVQPSSARIFLTTIVLIIASFSATIIAALIVGFIASVLPR